MSVTFCWYIFCLLPIYLGAIPKGREFLDTIVQQEDVRGVVSVTEAFELESIGCQVSSIPVPAGSTRNIQNLAHLHIAARDFVESPSVHQIENALSFIDQVKYIRIICWIIFNFLAHYLCMQVHSSTRGTIYIHCKAGRTRSATVVACYLVQRYSFKPEEAISRLLELRPHVVLAEPHRSTIEHFYSKIEAERQTRPRRSSPRY